MLVSKADLLKAIEFELECCHGRQSNAEAGEYEEELAHEMACLRDIFSLVKDELALDFHQYTQLIDALGNYVGHLNENGEDEPTKHKEDV